MLKFSVKMSLILKILGALQKKRWYLSFVYIEHLLYTPFSKRIVSYFMFIILICHYSPKTHVRKTFSLEVCRYSSKEAAILYRSRRKLYIAFSKKVAFCRCPLMEHPVYNVLKMYGVLPLFALPCFVNIYQKCMYKRHLFSKFCMLCERSGDIASFVEHAVYSNFKM